MQKDFYLDERALAAYFEKDWFDKVLETGHPKFVFAPMNPAEIYSDYHAQLIASLQTALVKQGAQPRRMLEVGSSLGRTFFEVCNRIKSIEHATLFEPSENLAKTHRKIFEGGERERFAVLQGNGELAEVALSTLAIQAACAAVKVSYHQAPFDKIDRDQRFDLVICSNVIDQCKDPEALMQTLRSVTAPGGVLLLSCTYQWQDKYIGNAAPPIRDINDLFGAEWNFMSETNLPFHLRVNERHWMRFMSHACVYQR